MAKKSKLEKRLERKEKGRKVLSGLGKFLGAVAEVAHEVNQQTAERAAEQARKEERMKLIEKMGSNREKSPLEQLLGVSVADPQREYAADRLRAVQARLDQINSDPFPFGTERREREELKKEKEKLEKVLFGL